MWSFHGYSNNYAAINMSYISLESHLTRASASCHYIEIHIDMAEKVQVKNLSFNMHHLYLMWKFSLQMCKNSEIWHLF